MSEREREEGGGEEGERTKRTHPLRPSEESDLGLAAIMKDKKVPKKDSTNQRKQMYE